MHQSEEQVSTAGERKNASIRKTIGERLSPLFMMSMECCLVYAILLTATSFFPGSDGPLLPIWNVFLVFLSLYGITNRLENFVRVGTGVDFSPGLHRGLARLVLGCAILICLLLSVWLRFYAQQFWLSDIAWLQALAHDVFQIQRGLQVFMIGILISIIAWLNHQMVEEGSNTATLLRKGGIFLAILAALSLGENMLRSNPDYWQTFLLLPIFFWFGLTHQALQKASEKRLQHTVGLEGDTRYQERIIFQSMFLLGLVALAAILMTIHIQNGLVTQTTPSHAVVLVPPLISTVPLPTPSPTAKTPREIPISGAQVFLSYLFKTFWWGAILCVIVVALISGIIFLRMLLKQRKKRVKKVRQEGSTSLWSWSLFLAQLKAFFFVRFKSLRRKPGSEAVKQEDTLRQAIAEVRDIRKIYQAFLRKAARQGYARASDETPRELQQRLQTHVSHLETELDVLTESYIRVRYGGNLPQANEVALAKKVWRELDRKWDHG